MTTVYAQAARLGKANPDRGEWLTRREIATRLKKTPRTIDSYVRRGYLPCIRVARSILFRWSEVEKHLANNFRVGRTHKKSHPRQVRSPLSKSSPTPGSPLDRIPTSVRHEEMTLPGSLHKNKLAAHQAGRPHNGRKSEL